MLTERDLDRFHAKVDQRGPDDCWPWTGGHTPYGYGAFWMPEGQRGRNHGAHRVAYLVANSLDTIPPNLFVCHRCDNPGCVNPTHLFLGTQHDNILDCSHKGRWKRPPTPQRGDPRIPHGEGHWRAKVTTAQVLDVRRRLQAGERQCAIMRATGIDRKEVQRFAATRDGRYRCWAHVVP